MTSFLSTFFIKYLSLEFDLSFCFHFFFWILSQILFLSYAFKIFILDFFEVSPKGCFKIIPNCFLDFFSYLYIFFFFLQYFSLWCDQNFYVYKCLYLVFVCIVPSSIVCSIGFRAWDAWLCWVGYSLWSLLCLRTLSVGVSSTQLPRLKF